MTIPALASSPAPASIETMWPPAFHAEVQDRRNFFKNWLADYLALGGSYFWRDNEVVLCWDVHGLNPADVDLLRDHFALLMHDEVRIRWTRGAIQGVLAEIQAREALWDFGSSSLARSLRGPGSADVEDHPSLGEA